MTTKQQFIEELRELAERKRQLNNFGAQITISNIANELEAMDVVWVPRDAEQKGRLYGPVATAISNYNSHNSFKKAEVAIQALLAAAENTNEG